jgi:hypothetical protein
MCGRRCDGAATDPLMFQDSGGLAQTSREGELAKADATLWAL